MQGLILVLWIYHLLYCVCILPDQPKYGNLTACQTLANMCTMIMYSRRPVSSACTSYLELTGAAGRDLNEWWVGMPLCSHMLASAIVLS